MKRHLFFVAALALGACKRDPRVGEEIERREAYARSLLLDAGGTGALGVGNSVNIHFVDGFSKVEFDPEGDWRGRAFRHLGKRGRVRLRVGDEPMHLRVGGWANEKVLRTRPSVSMYLDNVPISSGFIDEKGVFGFDGDLDPALTRGKEYVYLDIVPSTVGWHWAEPPELKVFLVFDVGLWAVPKP